MWSQSVHVTSMLHQDPVAVDLFYIVTGKQDDLQLFDKPFFVPGDRGHAGIEAFGQLFPGPSLDVIQRDHLIIGICADMDQRLFDVVHHLFRYWITGCREGIVISEQLLRLPKGVDILVSEKACRLQAQDRRFDCLFYDLFDAFECLHPCFPPA